MNTASAAQRIPDTQVQAQVEKELDAFQVALAQVKQAAAAIALHKQGAVDAKLSETLRSATRSAAWIAFDRVNEEEDKAYAAELADDMAKEIGLARGFEEDSAQLRMMRQRGRAFAVYSNEIAKEGAAYTVSKGKNKGEARNGRDERDPFTVAKVLLETKAAREARLAEHNAKTATYGQAALEAVAARLAQEVQEPVTAAEVATQAALGTGEEAQAVRNMIAEEIERLSDRASIFTDLRAMLARFSDASPEDKAKAYELAVEALAPAAPSDDDDTSQD